MRALLSLLFTASLLAAPPVLERWSLLQSGERYGTLEVSATKARTQRLHLTFSLRGFTHDLKGELTRDRHGLPTGFNLSGTQGSVPGYSETFRTRQGKATWTVEGEAKHGVIAGGFYLPSAQMFFNAGLVWLGGAEAFQQMRELPILPTGIARLAEVQDLDLTVGDRTVHFQQQLITGLGLTPCIIWRDAWGVPVAALNETDLQILEGLEAYAPQLEREATRTLKARLIALGASARLDFGSAFALIHVSVFDPASRKIHADQTVIVTQGRITAVGDAATTAIPPATRVISCEGKTLLPGFWDAHCHVDLPKDGPLAMASGVTSVYSPGDDPRHGPEIRKDWDESRIPGPWSRSALLLDGPGPRTAQVAVVVDSQADVLKALAQAKAEGYVGIKLYGSLKRELVPFIIQESRRQGFWVSGHVPAGYTIQDLVGLGFQEANHIYFALLGLWPDVKDQTNGMARFTTMAERSHAMDLKGKAVQDLIACFKAHGTVVDPTLVVAEGFLNHTPGEPEPTFGRLFDRLPAFVQRQARLQPDLAMNAEERRRNRASMAKILGFVRELREAGVPLVPGTDNYPLAYIPELLLYAKAGIPAGEILAMATLETAKVFGQGQETGSIEVGKRADLVLVAKDPTQDLHRLYDMIWVCRGGVVYDREKLLTGLGLRPKP